MSQVFGSETGDRIQWNLVVQTSGKQVYVRGEPLLKDPFENLQMQ